MATFGLSYLRHKHAGE